MDNVGSIKVVISADISQYMKAMQTVANTTQTTMQKIQSATGNGMSSTANKVSSAFSQLSGSVSNDLGKVATNVTPPFSRAGAAVQRVVSGIGQKIPSPFRSAFGSVRNIATQSTQRIGSALSGIGQFATKASSSLKGALSNSFSRLQSSSGRFFSNFQNNSQQVVNKGKEMGSSIGGIAKGIGVFSLVSKGLNVVKSSIGGAVERFDTLNKYPVVMKALGYSAVDVSQSMKTLDQGIDGLPTTLNAITASAQEFAPLTGNAKTAAKSAVALNDAFLASGASALDAEQGMTQYLQMLAVGKVDITSFQTLQRTMPIALGKVAAAFGYTGKSAEMDLFNALKSGKITIDQLNDKFVELDKGQNGFASLAKKNSAGIGTSFMNLGNSVIKGLGNVLKELDKLSQKLTGKSISQNLDQLKGVINHTFDLICKGVDKATPYLEKISDFIKEHSEQFRKYGGIVAKVIGAVLGFKLVVGILSKVGGFVFRLLNPFRLLKSLIPGTGGAFQKLGKSALGSSVNLLKTGTAILEIGAGVGLAATGIGVLAWGIAQLAKTGSSGVVALVAVTVSIAALAGVFALLGPLLQENALGIAVFGLAVSAIILSIAAASAGMALLIQSFISLTEHVDQIVPTLTAIGVGFANMIVGFVIVIQANIPLIVNTFISMITTFVTALAAAMPQLVQSGMQMILSILSGISSNIGQITEKAVEIMINFLNALALKIPDLVTAGVNLVVELVSAIASNASKLIDAGIDLVVKMLEGIADDIGKVIDAGVDLVVSVLEGIARRIPDIINAGMDLVDAIVEGAINAQGRLLDAAIRLINGFANNIRNRQDEIRGAAKNLLDAMIGVFVPDSLRSAGSSIIHGFLGGLKSAFSSVKSFVSGIADWIKDHKGPISYDRRLLVPAGRAMMEGFGDSLQRHFASVQSNVQKMGSVVQYALSQALQNQSYPFSTVLKADTRMIGSGFSSSLNQLSDDVQRAPRSAVNVQVINEWDGDQVRAYVNEGNARTDRKVNLVQGRV